MKQVAGPLAATMLVQAMVAMAVSVLPVLSPMLADAYGIRSSLIGIYASLVFAGAIFCTALGGTLVRRIGPIRCSQAALIVAGTALAMSASGPLAAILVFGVVTGMGYGLATPAASHILARVTPAERRGIVFSAKQSAVPIGGLLAGLLAPVFATLFGWQTSIIILATIVTTISLLIYPLRVQLDDDRDPTVVISLRSPLSAIIEAAREPALRGLTVTAFTFAALQSSIFAIFTAYLVDRGGLDLITAGQAFATLQTAGVVARLALGWVSDHWLLARRLLAIVGIGMSAVGLLAAQLSPSWPLLGVFAMSALVGFVAAGWPGVYLAEIVRSVPAERVSVATGGTVAFSFLGVVVGPALFSTIVTLSGSYGLAFVAFGMVTAGVGIWLWRAAP
jgi:MFS family permease